MGINFIYLFIPNNKFVIPEDFEYSYYDYLGCSLKYHAWHRTPKGCHCFHLWIPFIDFVHPIIFALYTMLTLFPGWRRVQYWKRSTCAAREAKNNEFFWEEGKASGTAKENVCCWYKVKLISIYFHLILMSTGCLSLLEPYGYSRQLVLIFLSLVFLLL